jgi:Uma2 family endonuclease
MIVVVVVNQPASLPESETVRPARFSAPQFLRMVDEGIFDDDHVELVHGEIIQLSPANTPHARMIPRLSIWLGQRIEADRILADAFIRLDDQSVRAFDLTVLREGSSPGDVLEPSDVLLGIEVARSSIRRDLGEKMRHYAAAAIANYLVVDLNDRLFHLMSDPQTDKFAKLIERSFDAGIDLPETLGRLQLP